MVKGYSTPPVIDYENIWGTTFNAASWTSGGSASQQYGTITTSDTADGSFVMARDLRGFTKFCFSLGVALHSEGSTRSAHSYGQMYLTDGGANTYYIVNYDVEAHGSSGNRWGVAFVGILGQVHLVPQSGKVLLTHNLQLSQYGYAFNGSGGGYSFPTATIVATGTLIDTSAWAQVYVGFSSTNTAGAGSIGAARITASAFEISTPYIGSKGTTY
jgi:hypothetical protein